MATGVKKTGLWDRGMAFDIPVQNVLEKNPLGWQTVVWPLGWKNLGLTDQGVTTGVTKFRMASGGLNSLFHFSALLGYHAKFVADRILYRNFDTIFCFQPPIISMIY